MPKTFLLACNIMLCCNLIFYDFLLGKEILLRFVSPLLCFVSISRRKRFVYRNEKCTQVDYQFFIR